MSHQQSDKHGPAIDDALQDERRQSSAGTRHEGRPEDDLDGGSSNVELRSDLARFIGPSAFPGDATQLRTAAAGNDATEQIRSLLEQLPEDRTYETTQQVFDALQV